MKGLKTSSKTKLENGNEHALALGYVNLNIDPSKIKYDLEHSERQHLFVP